MLQDIHKTIDQSDLQPGQALDLINANKDNPDFVILDVSTKTEFDQRRLDGAVNLSYLSRTFKSLVRQLDRSHTYLVYCAIGGRSKLAVRTMKKLGFQKAYNLVGGTLLWEEFGYPFAQGTGEIHKFTVCPVMNARLIKKKISSLFLGQANAKADNAGMDCHPANPRDSDRCGGLMPGNLPHWCRGLIKED